MKKFIAAVIVVMMLVAAVPMSVSAAEADTFTLYAYVPDGWDSPCFYGWGGSLSMTWPGEVMTAEADGWYSFEVAADAEGLIVNANNGSVQTPDIKSFEAKDMWVVVNADTTYNLYYELPEIVETAEPEVPEAPAEETEETAETAEKTVPVLANALCWGLSGIVVAASIAAGALLGVKKARKNS